MLTSKMLSQNERLLKCEVEDSAHVKIGDSGDHVKRIQQALLRIDNARIDDGELLTSMYGNTTATAVLNYKKKRNIVNYAYQAQPDNIVGKMTIKRLDEDILPFESTVSDQYNAVVLRPSIDK